MNILIISTQNPFQTSGVVAYDLFKGFKEQGQNVRLLVRPYIKSDDTQIVCMETKLTAALRVLRNQTKILYKKIIKSKKNTDSDYCFQDLDQTVEYFDTKKVIKKADFNPDIILYLFPQNFLNAKNLFELSKQTGAKIYWYLMDSAALTGGCHYSWNCQGFIFGCGKCPALFSENENDQTSKNFKFKKTYFDKTNLSIVTASEWQNNMSKVSLLSKNLPLHKILLSVNPEIFSFKNKNEAKANLGISAKKKVIFFGSARFGEKRKGIRYFFEALDLLKKEAGMVSEDILLLIAGRDMGLPIEGFPFEHKHLGMLKNNEELASAFQAADVFVCPSVEDSGPLMINQSIMCGTPVVSFKMGVSLDLVIAGVTGYRAELKNSADLAAGIKNILSLGNSDYNVLTESCRRTAIEFCHPEVQIHKFLKIFEANIG